MDPITSALSTLQLTLLNIALDDREEPYTPEERYEILMGVLARITELIEEVGDGTDLREAYRHFELRLRIRRDLGL